MGLVAALLLLPGLVAALSLSAHSSPSHLHALHSIQLPPALLVLPDPSRHLVLPVLLVPAVLQGLLDPFRPPLLLVVLLVQVALQDHRTNLYPPQPRQLQVGEAPQIGR